MFILCLVVLVMMVVLVMVEMEVVEVLKGVDYIQIIRFSKPLCAIIEAHDVLRNF